MSKYISPLMFQVAFLELITTDDELVENNIKNVQIKRWAFCKMLKRENKKKESQQKLKFISYLMQRVSHEYLSWGLDIRKWNKLVQYFFDYLRCVFNTTISIYGFCSLTIYSAKYSNMSAKEATADFKKKLGFLEEQYETMTEKEGLDYIKVGPVLRTLFFTFLLGRFIVQFPCSCVIWLNSSKELFHLPRQSVYCFISMITEWSDTISIVKESQLIHLQTNLIKYIIFYFKDALKWQKNDIHT